VAWRADSGRPLCDAPVVWRGPRFYPCGRPFDTPEAPQLQFFGCQRNVWLAQGKRLVRLCAGEYRRWNCSEADGEFVRVMSHVRC
jgi:hypothetical protein